jgi:hypothetical protein
VTDEKKDEASRKKMKQSLDDIVEKLEQDSKSSASWKDSISSHEEEWMHLKDKISERQKALKLLVTEKKAGRIGTTEFEAKYKKLQDELTELEFKVYNLRLGTNVE